MGDFVLIGVILLLGMAAYYSFSLMPRQREFVKRQDMARSLAEGDEVITAGGIVGRVMQIDGEKGIAYVEIAEGLQVRLVTASIIDRFDPDELAKNAQKGRNTTKNAE